MSDTSDSASTGNTLPASDSPSEAPSTDGVRPLRLVLPFMRPYLHMLAYVAAALLVSSAATLTLPVAVRRMVDLGFSDTPGANIDSHFQLLLAVAAIMAVSTAFRFYFVSRLGERVVADLRRAVYGHVLSLSPEFFERTRTGEILSRINTDTTVLQSLIGSGISVAARNVVMLTGSLIMLAITSPGLLALLLGMIPVVLVPLLAFGRRVRTLSRDSQDRIADTSAMATETLGAMQTVQSFTREGQERSRFNAAVEVAFDTASRRIMTRSLLTGMMITMIFGGVVLVLWVGAHRVLDGQLSVGELSQFVLYAIFMAGGAAVLAETWGEVQRAAGAMERIGELLHTQPVIRVPDSPLILPTPLRGEIHFDNASLVYPAMPERPALDGFDLHIAPGESVALVGASGAGKSSVFRLLLRFYDATGGCVRLDGVDIAQASPHAIREAIGIVPQDTVIFGASAADNIRYGLPEASDAQVVAAAKAAHADEFIQRLNQGYQTYLGERGVRLSTGQQQRLAIARAILKDAPVLLLDEATSALDAQSERAVQDALSHLMANRTTLVIAHRLATVLECDRIAVVDEGRIMQIGTHASLMEDSDLYRRFAELQFRDPLIKSAARAVTDG